MEVNPADIAGVRIRYQLGGSEFSNPPVRRVPTAAAQPPTGVRHAVRAAGVGALPPPNGHVGGEYALLGEPGGLGWEICADEEILLSSCGLSPPTPGNPRNTSLAKPRPAEKPKPPAVPPPLTQATQKNPPTETQVR